MNRATNIGLGLVVASVVSAIYHHPGLYPALAFLTGCICFAIGDDRKGKVDE